MAVSDCLVLHGIAACPPQLSLSLYLSPSCSFNVTLKLNSNLVKDKEIPVTAVMEWPRLIRNDKIDFPLTYIENSSVSPSVSSPLVAHVGEQTFSDPHRAETSHF